MITLDDFLGAGAKAAHDEAITVYEGDSVDRPTVYETEWQVISPETQWPYEDGPWVLLSNLWQNGVRQQGLYKAGKAYFGNGVCQVDNGLSIAENLAYIYKSNFIEWCTEYGILDWYVILPHQTEDADGNLVGEDYVSMFLAVGFDLYRDLSHSSIVRASVAQDGKHYEWLVWMKSGFDESLKPEWV